MFFLCLMLAGVLLISGCGKVEYLVEMNPDGFNQVTARVTMNNTAAKLGGRGDLEKQLSQDGYSVTTRQNGGSTVIEGVKTVPPGDLQLPFADRYIKGQPVVNAQHRDYFFFKTFTFYADCELDPQMKQRIPDHVSLTVSLPGRIMQSNNAVTVEHQPLQWMIHKKDARITAAAKSYVIYYERIAALLAIGLGLFWRRQRKSR